MFKNYLIVAIRNIARHKVYSFINIAGLSVGITCCVLIGLYIHHELRYDQFHTKSDRIYRMVKDMRSGDNRIVTPVTSRFVKQLFGADDPMGKVVSLNGRNLFQGDLVVRGVMENNLAEASYLSCDVLVTGFTGQGIQRRSIWDGWGTELEWPRLINFALLRPDANVHDLEQKLNSALPRYLGEEINGFAVLSVDEDYIPFFDIKLMSGRNFSLDIPGDVKKQAYILNKSAVKHLGLESPIGKEISWRNQKGHVIGVVEDYNFMSLHFNIAPQILYLSRQRGLYIKFGSEDIQETVAFVKTTLSQFAKKPVHAEFFFGGNLSEPYSREIRMSSMVTTFSGLAIFLACLGLFGLVSYAAEVRTKEIGIRKVLGASVSSVVMLLSKDFVKLVIIANVIAWPVAYYAANRVAPVFIGLF